MRNKKKAQQNTGKLLTENMEVEKIMGKKVTDRRLLEPL